MPTYKYKCSGCEKIYLEHRDITDPQFLFNCDVCAAAFIEVTE